jgi:CheY-like chemotaxis protein
MAEILFVEDQPEVIRGIRKMLERRKHQVSVVGNGRDAIRRLKNRQYDVIVLDVVLPKGVGGDIDLENIYQQAYGQEVSDFPRYGIEDRMGLLILRAIVDKKIQTPIIFLSAYITKEVRDELEVLKEKGIQIVEVLDKPAKSSAIIEAIQNALKPKPTEEETKT